MNQSILDGYVLKDTKLFDKVASFNISSVTGTFTDINGNKRKRYTYIRVIYPKDITPEAEEIIKEGNYIRIYGKLDSEQYKNEKGRIVYNKVLCAYKVVKLEYDVESGKYIERRG